MAELNESFARKLPYSLEAEQSVLGSILIDPEKFNEVAGIIRSDDFYLSDHQEIFLAMQNWYLQNRQIDLVTLINMMVASGIADETKAKEYIRLIADIVPSAQNVRDYAKIVKDKSMLRQLIAASEDITETAYGEQGDVVTILDHAEQSIFAIAQNNETKGFVHIKDILLQTYDHLHQVSVNKAEMLGTPTGFSDLDRVLVGMGKSDLLLVGARPGMGKTSFCLNIASNVALATKKAVCVFSLEMSNEQLVSRMLSSEALVDSHALRSGEISPEDWMKLAQASAKLSECDIYIDDTTGITVTGMKAKLRRIKNLGFVVIDYLQLMQSDKRIDNRVQEVGEISRNLKILAKELNVPVMVCAQLSRGPESRTDKRPMLSDLRDSGAIEQDADVVLFLFRDEYYDKTPEKANVAECIIAKNRHGSTGTVEMGWQGQFTRFYSRDMDHGPEGGAG
ncbi:MAG: replicative DNA helicase [Clostridia bacterium]|nr:replicative DNA helicase [Clostridia bacterium]